MFLLGSTDPSQKRNAGLSVFNIEMNTPGIEIRPIKYMNGAHFYNEVFFTDVRVHRDELIGAENNRWKLTRATMNFERSGSGAYAGLTRAFEELLNYVKTTKRDGRPLSENPIVRQKLHDSMRTSNRVGPFHTGSPGCRKRGKMAFTPAAASEAKVFSTELRQRMVNFATEIMGP